MDLLQSIQGFKRIREVLRPKEDNILNHSPQLIEGLRFSTQEFYQRVEAALAVKQLPDVDVRRVDLSEGGMLAAKRQYLRCRRERLHYDFCAMPYGSGFFVSEWFWEEPQRIGLAALVVAAVIVGLVVTIATGPDNAVYEFLWRMLFRHFDFAYRSYHGSMYITIFLIAAPIVLVLAAIVWFGEYFDGLLIRFPLIGFIYEKRFRRVTFYRRDRTAAFRQAVHGAFTQVLHQLCETQGIAPPSELTKRPIHQELKPGGDAPASGRSPGDGNPPTAGDGFRKKVLT
jgi:hypothetical protein